MRTDEILKYTEHRQYPLPTGPWALTQTWTNLLFAHWPLAPEVVAATLPPGLPVDTYEHQAWLSIVPFVMRGVRPHAVTAVPWLSDFEELNLRTYVTLDGRPGVFFYSLDANNPVAVRLARRFFQLPYFNARQTVTKTGEWTHYNSKREAQWDAPAGNFVARYRATGPAREASAGSLEDWLTARYCFYTTDQRDGIYRCEIQHAPWHIQPAELDIEENTLPAIRSFTLPDTPPLLQFSATQQVVAWPIQRIASLAPSDTSSASDGARETRS